MTIEEQIQFDLDDGKYGMICSNEDTFKRYVFPLIEKAKQEEKNKWISTIGKARINSERTDDLISPAIFINLI